MKENKGLSDKELAAKYEAGAIDLSKVIKESQEKCGLLNGLLVRDEEKILIANFMVTI
jgi:hypothetical protein